ncbi:hypothetical protein L208DRAFT_1287236 [Tricholoma matsutake]|nr:hypothetical protein L208DRAFT_1287236 [Tricholoma matsutake 945]
MVTQQEAALFAAEWNIDEGESSCPCCDASHFRFDILRMPHSPWNRSAARVFCDDLIMDRDLPSTPDIMESVMESFYMRLKTLKRDYKLSLLQPAERLISARDTRCHQQKYNIAAQLFQRRLEIAKHHPNLQKHVAILQRLGVEGMSSDESDRDETTRNPQMRLETPRVHVLLPQWRTEHLATWLHIFDSLHMVERWSMNGSSRGAYPHMCIYNAHVPRFSRSTGFVRGLLRNAYDACWLADRWESKFSVHPQDKNYNFSHDLEIFK